MSICDDTALVKLDDTLWADYPYGGGALELSRLSHRRLYLQDVGVCHTDLNLRLRSCRAKDANVLYRAHRRTDDRKRFLTGVLSRLRKLLYGGKLLSLAEKPFHVTFGKMYMAV